MINKYYEGTQLIINLSIEIGKLLGIIDSNYLRLPKTSLRKENRIKTIASSLGIEGNTLSIDQITTIFENKKVIGPKKDIIEVKNAIEIYSRLSELNPLNEKSFLKAHSIIMKELIDNSGEYRTGGVGIFKGDQLAHMTPPAWNVSNLMKNLFNYAKTSKDNNIIKSCVFHYEMEFIHPFMDGNGRMGRLWQTLILMQENPVFEYLPIEQEIKENQEEYYRKLSESDKEGISTKFVEYMLERIKRSLESMVDQQRISMNEEQRIEYFLENWKGEKFTRKEYLNLFKDISPPTASRDLRKGVENGKFEKFGDKRTTKYNVKK